MSEASLSANENVSKSSDVNFVNPFKDVLSLKTAENIKNVEIFDQNGRLVLRSSKAEINTSSLSKGVYQIKITTQSDRVISKKGTKL